MSREILYDGRTPCETVTAHLELALLAVDCLKIMQAWHECHVARRVNLQVLIRQI